MTYNVEKPQNYIALIAPETAIFNDERPAEIHVADVRQEGDRTPLKEILQILKKLKCVREERKWFTRTFDGQEEPEKCLGCILDKRCGPQGTLESSDNSGTDIEKKLRANFNYEVALSCIEYLQFLDVPPQNINQYENWSAVYMVLIERLNEMPKMQIVEELLGELDAYYKIYSVNFGVYIIPEPEVFWDHFNQEISDYMYSIYINTELGVRGVIKSLNLRIISDGYLNKKWRAEGKKTKSSGSRRTYSISQLFQTYVEYLKSGNNINSVAKRLTVPPSEGYIILNRHNLRTKLKQNRAEILGIENNEKALMNLFNFYWNQDITFSNLANMEISPYKEKVLNERFKNLFTKYKNKLQIKYEDFEKFRNEVRLFTTKKPTLELNKILECYKSYLQVKEIMIAAEEHNINYKLLRDNFYRLGLTEISEDITLIRHGDNYAILKKNGEYKLLSKLDYRIASLAKEGKNLNEIHKIIYPFYWIEDKRIFIKHITSIYNPIAEQFGLHITIKSQTSSPQAS
jgi:hypothetical protein